MNKMELFITIMNIICIVGIAVLGIIIVIRKKNSPVNVGTYSEETIKRASEYRAKLVREQAENDAMFAEERNSENKFELSPEDFEAAGNFEDFVNSDMPNMPDEN